LTIIIAFVFLGLLSVERSREEGDNDKDGK